MLSRGERLRRHTRVDVPGRGARLSVRQARALEAVGRLPNTFPMSDSYRDARSFGEGLVFNRCRDCADAGFIPAFLGALNRFSSRAARPAQASRASQSPHIVVGITSAQTCLVLQGRLRVLREAGFRVTLVSSPGDLLTRTAAQEGVESVAIPMQREIAPLADLLSLLRLCWLLCRLKPDMTEFSTPKAGLVGSIAALLCRVPARVYFLRGLKLETCDRNQAPHSAGRRETGLRSVLMPCCATVTVCATRRSLWAWRRRANCACWAAAAATASMWSASIPELAACAAGLAFRTMLMWWALWAG